MAATICREYGWTWHEYQEQPATFIETIKLMFKAEADEAKRQSKK